MFLAMNHKHRQISIAILTGAGSGYVLLGGLWIFNQNQSLAIKSSVSSQPSASGISIDEMLKNYPAQSPVASTSVTIPQSSSQSLNNGANNMPIESSASAVNNPCPDQLQPFVIAETNSFNIYICGQSQATQYIGTAKDSGSSIRLNLASASRDAYVAKNGITAYTITRNSLEITQNGRILQTQSLRVSQWRN
jgi:hypothetical protein